MPSWKEVWIACVVACVCAVIVVLVLHAFGQGEHAAIAAAVSGSTSAGVAAMSFGRTPEEGCKA